MTRAMLFATSTFTCQRFFVQNVAVDHGHEHVGRVQVFTTAATGSP
ncbi:MAG: hypothetical protein ACLUW6_05340 [Coriobacteriaceae bacterium]